MRNTARSAVRQERSRPVGRQDAPGVTTSLDASPRRILLTCFLDAVGLCDRGGTGRRAGLRILWGNPWGFESLRSHRRSRQLVQQLIDHRLLVLEEAFVAIHEQCRRTPFGIRRMTDVRGVDPELDAERLQTAEDSLVVLGDGREAGSQPRELPDQPHTLSEAAPELLGRVVWNCGSACADHRRCSCPARNAPLQVRDNVDRYRTAQDAQPHPVSSPQHSRSAGRAHATSLAVHWCVVSTTNNRLVCALVPHKNRGRRAAPILTGSGRNESRRQELWGWSWLRAKSSSCPTSTHASTGRVSGWGGTPPSD